MRGSWKWVGVMALVAAVSGCAGAPPPYPLGAVQPSAIYARRAAVRVRIPKSSRALDGDRILVRAGGSALSLLPEVSLGDRLPEVVAASLVETLRNARIRAFGERETPDVDFDLELEIKDFAFDAPSHTVKVSIAAKLVALANGAVVGSRLFSAGGAVGSSDPRAVFAALDAALRRTSASMTTFVGEAIY